MNIGITGASGFIGGAILDLALRRGHEVVAFTRDPARSIPGCEMRAFALSEPPNIDGCEAIIHLAAEPILGLWTKQKRRRIVESRLMCADISVLGCTFFQSAWVGRPLPRAAQLGKMSTVIAL